RRRAGRTASEAWQGQARRRGAQTPVPQRAGPAADGPRLRLPGLSLLLLSGLLPDAYRRLRVLPLLLLSQVLSEVRRRSWPALGAGNPWQRDHIGVSELADGVDDPGLAAQRHLDRGCSGARLSAGAAARSWVSPA